MVEWFIISRIYIQINLLIDIKHSNKWCLKFIFYSQNIWIPYIEYTYKVSLKSLVRSYPNFSSDCQLINYETLCNSPWLTRDSLKHFCQSFDKIYCHNKHLYMEDTELTHMYVIMSVVCVCMWVHTVSYTHLNITGHTHRCII